MLEPQQVLVWVCVIVFAATSAITLLGIIKKVDIDPTFLNRLFIALILEVVAISVLAFKDSFKPRPITEFIKIVTPANGTAVGQWSSVSFNVAYNKLTEEVFEAELRTTEKNITLTNYSSDNNIFQTNIDTSLISKNGNTVLFVSIYKEKQRIVSDSIVLKR